MMTRPLYLSFLPQDDLQCMETIQRHALPPREADRATIGLPQVGPGQTRQDWSGPRNSRALLQARRRDFALYWHEQDGERRLGWRGPRQKMRTSMVVFSDKSRRADLGYVEGLLQFVPFLTAASEIASTGWDSPSGTSYSGPGFGDLHYGHGWLCAFKGVGHDQLVSRRWLRFGPWRLLEDEGDLSIVQFHDLETDDQTALEQAKIGHERMGCSPTGGFIDTFFLWTDLTFTAYDEKAETLIQFVADREVEQSEMLEAAAVKFHQHYPKPVRQVAYVFHDEANARRHLHELWLRGLEVRVAAQGRDRRIDEDHNPEPVRPDWVKRLQDREGR